MGEEWRYKMSCLRTLALKWRRTKERPISRASGVMKPSSNKTTKVSRLRVVLNIVSYGYYFILHALFDIEPVK